MKTAFADLWRLYPAVLYSFAVLLGSSFALYQTGFFFLICASLIITFPLFIFPYKSSEARILLALTLGIASFYLTTTRYHFPPNTITKGGIADIEMISIKKTRTPFGYLWVYKGTLKSYIKDNHIIAKDLPVLISIPFHKDIEREKADFRYQFPANLKQNISGKYSITPIKNETWQPLEKLNNLAEWRYEAKSKLQKHIEKSIQNPHVRSFLSGIATGEFDDRLLSFELSRFGLQHLMAISGLHFSIISGLLVFSLGLFFSRHHAALGTIGLMSVYFIFLGPSPSVTRAWITILIGLMSFFIKRKNSAFNALGIAALAQILWNPLIIEEIGFQFSYGITAAILLWFPPFDGWLQYIFPKRKLSEVINVDLWDQHAYCFLHFLRQSLALCLAVNIIALPLTLYHFHQFPVMSLLYNLFFPFLLSFSLIFLVISCAFGLFFPWLSSHLHSLNESYTQFVLNFAFNLPKKFDVTLEIQEIPKDILLIYLFLVFTIGIVLKKGDLGEFMIKT